MGIRMVRIDDRLVHGQIVAAWGKELGITRIWVIDDGVAQNSFIGNVMKMAAPAETTVDITPVDKIEELVAGYDDSDENVLVVMKTPDVAKRLFEAGVRLRELNVGGMGAKEGRSKLFKNISASDAEVETLGQIQASGVDVYYRVVPSDMKTEFTGR